MTAAFIIKDHEQHIEIDVGDHHEFPWSNVTFTDKKTGSVVTLDAGDFHRMWAAVSDAIDANDEHLKLTEAMAKRSPRPDTH
jgi:hypothetical protein